MAMSCASVFAATFDYNGTPITSEFQITTTALSANDYIAFQMSAAGNFYIDWGDGNVENIDRSNNKNQAKYSHTYASAGTYTIQFGGTVTGYNSNTRYAAIQFGGSFSGASANNGSLSVNANTAKTRIAGLSGSIGSLFKTLQSTSVDYAITTPSFYQAFYGCSNLTGTIPDNLFSDVTEGSQYKFYQMFTDCTNLYGPVPETLFADITGSVGTYTFREMFKGCTNLGKNAVGGTSTYYVPSGLFTGITLSTSTINSTFTNTGLLTACPAGSYIYTGYSSYISTWGNKASCTACAAGTYNASTGQSSCTECATGTYNPDTGATSASACLSCAAGTYNNLTGQSACTQCDANTYNPDTGSTSALACLACPANTTSPAGSTSVSDCVSQSSCPGGMPKYNGTCAVACNGLEYLKTNNVSIPVFGNKLTTHAIHVSYNGNDCYVPMESGSGSNTINMQHGNDQYHAVIVQ